MAIARFKTALKFSEHGSILKYLLTQGDSSEIQNFENCFASYVKRKAALMVPSGRSGLFLLLKHLKLKEGFKVLIPAFTFYAVPAAVVAAGGKPIFVDASRETFTMDLKDLEQKVTLGAELIIPTHLFGLPGQLTDILNFAEKHNLLVIEDCAQGLGAKFNSRPLGSIGYASYFTFGITKNFTTLLGGMIASDDEACIQDLRKQISEYQKLTTFTLLKTALLSLAMSLATIDLIYSLTLWPLLAFFSLFSKDPVETFFEESASEIKPEIILKNWRNPHPAQGKIGVYQLKSFAKKNQARREKALKLISLAKDAGITDKVIFPKEPEKAQSIFTSLPILVQNRQKIKNYLIQNGIDCTFGYMRSCAHLPQFLSDPSDCPQALQIQEQILHLPINANMKLKTLEKMVRVLQKATQ